MIQARGDPAVCWGNTQESSPWAAGLATRPGMGVKAQPDKHKQDLLNTNFVPETVTPDAPSHVILTGPSEQVRLLPPSASKRKATSRVGVLMCPGHTQSVTVAA